ncbi:MAG TPA: tRNA (adenosine(37)-N6)-threonylcarbamoyltransferase complex ATPase subunit type 1 TsaE, partial [Paracoccaceae bacterium]|nr:tRNA (adenosine(37)-N6)-threonylcarbamoyltransferase complex ATPase subunit type 1 TsaE [Paracoccaceae bacterium]
PDEAATGRLGAAVAPHLGPGDAVLLAGPLGAGKTSLARAIIGARLAAEGRGEEVPSPSFTLVQVYETARGEIWHVDLYRLAEPDEVVELGLTEAFGAVISLVEWPERLGPHLPPRHLMVALAEKAEGRTARIMPAGPGWEPLLRSLRA